MEGSAYDVSIINMAEKIAIILIVYDIINLN